MESEVLDKSMISEGAAGQGLAVVWYLLAAASAGVFLHAGIKFPWFVFFHRDSGLRPPDPPFSMKASMALLAALCLILGTAPDILYRLLPYPVDYVPYTALHVVQQLQLLMFSGLAFFLMLPLLRRTETISLDIDVLWRRLWPRLWRWLMAWSSRRRRRISGRLRSQAGRLFAAVYRHQGPGGILARARPTGSMAFWATVLLAAYLILYYL